jgi:hypothetical protein
MSRISSPFEYHVLSISRISSSFWFEYSLSSLSTVEYLGHLNFLFSLLVDIEFLLFDLNILSPLLVEYQVPSL